VATDDEDAGGTVNQRRDENGPAGAAPAEGDLARGDTRRKFVERLAKTAALPLVVPLMLSMSSAAFAY
jgi:hypothetical protein